MIKLRDDVIFKNPQSRIRECCEIEVCQGYDDRHSINHKLTQQDINAANELNAMIDRYDNSESKRLLSVSKNISSLLSSIPNTDIYSISNKEWLRLRSKIGKLLTEFLSIKGIGLAKTTKILHLKRPNLIPVLDSFIVKFLLDIDISDEERDSHANIGLQTLDRIREIMIKQRLAFEKLVGQMRDLPIKLTPLRMFDILCWTAEKWDIRRIHSAPYGIPSKSLLSLSKSKKDAAFVTQEIGSHDRYVVFEDLERTTCPKMHHTSCFYYKRWLRNRTTTTNWHGPYKSKEKAWQTCKRLALKSGFKPSKHKCVG